MSKKEQNEKGREKDENPGGNDIDQKEVHDEVAQRKRRQRNPNWMSWKNSVMRFRRKKIIF